jgi:hypothetical protein
VDVAELTQAEVDAARQRFLDAARRAPLPQVLSRPSADVKVHPLVALCSKLLTEFLAGETGHPGRPARRSRWVDVTQLEAWQDQLAELAVRVGVAEPARCWRSERKVMMIGQSGLLWTGPLQLVITPEGDPLIVIRSRSAVHPVSLSEEDGTVPSA